MGFHPQYIKGVERFIIRFIRYRTLGGLDSNLAILNIDVWIFLLIVATSPHPYFDVLSLAAPLPLLIRVPYFTAICLELSL